MKSSRSVRVGIAACIPLTFLCVTGFAALPAEQPPTCPSLAATSVTLTAGLASGIRKLHEPGPKSDFEKTVEYERRIAQEVEKHNQRASEAFGKDATIKMTLPVSTRYDAERELLRFEAPSMFGMAVQVGLRKVTFSTFSTRESSDVREGRVGNAAIGIGKTSYDHESYGMAFLTPPTSQLLKRGAKHSVKLSPAEAKRLSNQLAVVVVGRPAPPYGLAKYSSGNSMIANGRLFQETYHTDYAVVSLVCAYLVDQSTNSAIELR